MLASVTAEHFTKFIERTVAAKSISYMDAILDFCEKRQIDPDMIAPFVGDKLKQKLSEEAQALHMMPKRRSLPIDD